MSRRRPLIYFDQTQNERGRLDSTYSELGRLLKDNDFDVQPYSEFMILPKVLEHAQVIVFGCPNSSKLRKAEIDTLHNYVKNGGGLMLLSLSGGDKGLMNNMSQVSEEFGVTFENTAVKDDRENAGLPTMPLIKELTDHPTTQGIQNLLLPSACTLKVTGDAEAVATTSDTADPPSQPVIAICEYGKGRVVCISSYEVFRRGGGLKHKGNQTFAVNTFSWLSRMVTTEPETSTDEEQPTRKKKRKTATSKVTATSEEMENTMKRLVDAVFDLQKDITELTKKTDGIDKNIEELRNQFQSFAEKTQSQLGVMIPAKQFKTEEENKVAIIEDEIKSIESELKSVENLQDHIEQRYSSGAMPREAYEEQSEKLDERAKAITKKIEKKKKELEKLNESERKK